MKMKMNRATYDRLSLDCANVLIARGVSPDCVRTTRAMWEVFHCARAYYCYDADLTDAHIETALKNIFRN